MGLLSVLDVMMNAPMETVLAGLSLAEHIRDALTTRSGLHGAMLESALACERGDPQVVVPLKLSKPQAAQAYLDAQTWATESAATLAATR
jgi:c-di-GMP-related signal transduction protein